MTMLTLTLLAVLSQNGQDATPAANAPAAAVSEKSATERAVEAAEKAAAAAEKAALAAQKVAESVAPPAAAAAEPEAAKGDAAKAWLGVVGVGLQFITGNAQTLTLTGNLSVDRKWENWNLGIKASGAYGLTNPNPADPASASDTTARRAQLSVRGDRKFGTFASIFALGGTEFDHVKNVESRTFGELGSGLTFFDTKDAEKNDKLFLRLDLAMRGGYETRYQYFPETVIDPYGLIILAPRVALAFRWNFNKHVKVTEDLEFIPFLLAPEAGRLLINNATKLSARITENVAITATLLVNFDSSPPQVPPPAIQRRTTDVALTAGLEASF